MKTLLLVSIALPVLASCLDDDPQPGCYQEEGRSIVATITDVEGTIRGPGIFCPDVFVIEPVEKNASRPLGSFDPCNLPNEFEEESTRVVFSGYVYESFENEDICADFFEITSIRILDP